MFKLNQKGAIQFIVIAILLLGIVAGVYLIKGPLKFFPRAASGPISGPVSPSPTATPTPTPAPTPDNQAPTVSITNPQNGSSIKRKAIVNITAIASDNIAVSSVEFYVNADILCTDNTEPYNCLWTVPNPKSRSATYTLTAKAYDSSENSSQAAVTITVK